MKKLEDHQIQAEAGLTDSIRDFWSRNVNAERLMGQTITSSMRGESDYFKDLAEQRYRSHRHLLPWIHSMDTGKSVLEIGCGVGLDSYEIARRGLMVTAVDLTDVAIQTARKRFQDNGLEGEFRTANAEKLPFPDNHFDYVYSFGVLHHAADTQQCIREAFRVVKPGGAAMVMLYHRHSLNELVHRILRVPFEERDELCPVVRRYTREEIRDLFSQFSTVDIHVDYLYGEGYGTLFRLTPVWFYNFLSKYIGWHLMIRATK
ncbi:MAG: ubiquinone/menaquinone biosynthesis C-methylase UbiE [Planctomycetota bacterium]|jgi:ubiquinone/menaquinone biosynthesis C-methylase UbiE